MYYTSNIFFIIVIALSKLSVVCFLFRLTVVKSQQIAFYALGATILAWMVGSVFAVALQCNLSHPWIIVGEQCSGSVSLTEFWDEIVTANMPAVYAMESHRRLRHHNRNRHRWLLFIPRLGSLHVLLQESNRRLRLWLPSWVSDPPSIGGMATRS